MHCLSRKWYWLSEIPFLGEKLLLEIRRFLVESRSWRSKCWHQSVWQRQGQTLHSHFDLSSPTPIVSVACAVIPVPKASLDIWDWRKLVRVAGCERTELCKMHICGRRQKLVSRDIRASLIKLIARRVPIRSDRGSCWDCQGRASWSDICYYRRWHRR